MASKPDIYIEPDDIKQGALGDCYFLCAIASLAEKTPRIKNLFVSQKVSYNGIYGVKMCEMGEWKIQVIDDQFPCRSR